MFDTVVALHGIASAGKNVEKEAKMYVILHGTTSLPFFESKLTLSYFPFAVPQ
jgi:hypothetical protein